MAASSRAPADTDAFWANIVAGTNAITEVPPERWDVATATSTPTGTRRREDPVASGAASCDDVAFDPLAYGIPPDVARRPSSRCSCSRSRWPRRRSPTPATRSVPFDRERTSVVFGAEAGTDLAGAYGFRATVPALVGDAARGARRLPARAHRGLLPRRAPNVIAGRIANRLDLGGVNYTVDAACAASLAALDAGVQGAAAGTSDMVLCGGADLHNGINDYLLFASVTRCRPTGQCHPFDAAADGIALGEGVACVVLKRLADAERDGDRIYAVIKGVGGSSDGRDLGLTAPRKEGQVRALERAYAQAGVVAGRRRPGRGARHRHGRRRPHRAGRR